MDVSASAAEVGTERPARYGKQLVAHLSRRSGGEWSEDDGQGWIQLGDGRAVLASGPGVLRIRIEGPGADLERIEDVVGRHLVRFGTKDELVVRWVRDSGEPGTEQRSTES